MSGSATTTMYWSSETMSMAKHTRNSRHERVGPPLAELASADVLVVMSHIRPSVGSGCPTVDRATSHQQGLHGTSRGEQLAWCIRDQHDTLC